jgi:hypothetical protein
MNDARFQFTIWTITGRTRYAEVDTQAEASKKLLEIKADSVNRGIFLRDTETGKTPSYTKRNGRWYLDQ